MRDLVAAPQAPARNPPPRDPAPAPALDTYNSHSRIKRPKLGDRRVYRPVRRHTLSRIDELPQLRPVKSASDLHQASGSMQVSDFSSMRPILRSRSNISADTSRSVPVCNQSYDLENQVESTSPQYAEPRGYDSNSSYDPPASMTDLPIMVPVDPATGAYIPYPEYTYYHDDGCGLNRYKWSTKGARRQSKNNLFLAFMY